MRCSRRSGSPTWRSAPSHRGRRPGTAPGRPAGRVAPAGWVVESVKVRGRVRGDSAILEVELTIVTAADDPTWVPIRLDDQRLIGAREGARVLDLRMAGAGRWLVELVRHGTHRVEVDLRCPLMTRPARAALSLAIPEAPSTSLELDFDRRETDLIVGANEVYGQADLPDGKGSRLSAHLTPRPRIEVSWAVDTEVPGRNPPLLTAQGDIAIDIDSEQMRTRSSWVIRCVRGLARTLEVRFGEQDELTELRLDDQQTEARIDGAHGEPAAGDPDGRAAPARRGETPAAEDPPLLCPGRRTPDRLRRVPDHPRPRAVRGNRCHAEREPVGGAGVIAGIAADPAHLPAAGAAQSGRRPAWPSSSSTSRSRWTSTSRRRRPWSARDRGPCSISTAIASGATRRSSSNGCAAASSR